MPTICQDAKLKQRKELFGSLDNTTAIVLGGGTNAYPIESAKADKNFFDFRTKSTATSGDSRGFYLRHYLAGAGISGEAARLFTTVYDVAGGTAHGAHISLSFGTSGSLTGLGVAGRNTLQIPNAAMSGGTFAAVQAEIWSDGATSAVSGVTDLAFIRVVNDGNATGVGRVDDKANLFQIVGGADATGNMCYGNTIRCKVLGSTKYLVLSSAENSNTLSSRIDFTGITVAAADGALLKAGTSAAPLSCSTTANTNFVQLYAKSEATSGTARGIYARLYLAGAGGEGEALRAFTTINGVVAAGGSHGAHISLSMDATGSTSGLGVGCRVTLDAAAATRVLTGALAAIQVDSNVGAGNTMPTYTSYIRVAKVGSVDLANLFDIQPSTCSRKGSAPSASDGIQILLDGTPVYLMIGT